jgi:hypothetical protein
MEMIGMTRQSRVDGRRVSRVESTLLRLFQVSSSDESAIEDDLEANLSQWNDALQGQRSRIARRLALIDAQLGLTESRPVLSVITSR